jgi:hypothetical protein
MGDLGKEVERMLCKQIDKAVDHGAEYGFRATKLPTLTSGARAPTGYGRAGAETSRPST